MKRPHFALAAVAVTSFGLLAGAAFGVTSGQRRSMSKAAWAYKTDDINKMVRDVDAIVVAQLTAVRQGRVASSSQGDSSLAFELNDFAILETLKGLPTTAITIERVSNVQGGKFIGFDHDVALIVGRNVMCCF